MYVRITSNIAGTEDKKKKEKKNRNGPANGELRRVKQPLRRALGREGPTCPITDGR